MLTNLLLKRYNEPLRQTERYLHFDVPALKCAIASSLNCSSSDITSFTKVAEGGFNRIFQASFKDGRKAIARLPYPSTAPKHYAVANEVATLDFLRLNNIPVPTVYASSSTASNPVGAEYIIMEKIEGTALGEIWYSMTTKDRYKVMKQIVELERHLFSLELPASGSIYYKKDLRPEEKAIEIPLQADKGRAFCIGPMAHYSWWHSKRELLSADRGPCKFNSGILVPFRILTDPGLNSNDLFQAVGKRELEWCRSYAKPRLHYETLYREIYHFQQMEPKVHVEALLEYCKMARCLGFPGNSVLNKPVLRHPDFQPNNILVSETKDIVGVIDWQHSTVVPLCLAAGIPKHFQNYGDPESESLSQPPHNPPSTIDTLSPDEQASIRERHRRQVVHFLYAAFTRRLNEEHYDAIFNDCVIRHQRLYKSADSPWEGDSITLQADMIRAVQDWETIASEGSIAQSETSCSAPPIKFPDATIQEVLSLDAKQKEAESAMDEMRDALGVDVMGWVSSDEEYRATKERAMYIKNKMLEAAETEEERIGVTDHFPFDDHDEDG